MRNAPRLLRVFALGIVAIMAWPDPPATVTAAARRTAITPVSIGVVSGDVPAFFILSLLALAGLPRRRRGCGLRVVSS